MRSSAIAWHADFGLSVGSTITVKDLNHGSPAPIRITGVFDLPNLQSAYWFGDGASHFPFGREHRQALVSPPD